MKGAWTIARKEGADVLREKSIAVAIIVQAVVAATSAFLAVGLLGLYDADSIESYPEADLAYVGEGGFYDRLSAPYNLNVFWLNSTAAVDAFNNGQVYMIVEEEVANASAEHRMTLVAAEGEVETTLLLTQVRSLLQLYENELRAERDDRIAHEILVIDTPERSGLPYAFMFATLLPLLVLTPVFLSGAVASDSFVQEIHQRTLQLLRSAPVSPIAILTGKLITPIVIAPMQVLLWVGLLRMNDIPVAGIGTLLLITTLMSLVVCSLGILTGSLVKQEGQAQAAYALVAIMLAGVSIWLPRDPLNVIALAGSGGMDSAAWQSIAWIGALGLSALVAAYVLVGRRMQTDKL